MRRHHRGCRLEVYRKYALAPGSRSTAALRSQLTSLAPLTPARGLVYAAWQRMSRGRVASLAVLIAALLFRLVLALALANDEPDDGRLYALLAHNLIAHGVYSASEEAPYAPADIRVPGYPLFLASLYGVFGDDNNTAVRVVQACIDTATCWLVGLLAAAWTPREWPQPSRARAGIVALALAAACPFPAIYVATMLTETLAMFAGTLTVLLATRALQAERNGQRSMGGWMLTGAAAAATALIRPEFILYASAAGLAFGIAVGQPVPRQPGRAQAWVRRVLPAGIALGLGVSLVLAPWTIRNALVFGELQPLNPRSVAMPGEFVAYGYARWVRTWIDHPRYVAPALFTVDLAPIRIEALPPYAFDSPAQRSRVAGLLAAYNTPPPEADPDDNGQLPPGGMTPAIDAGFARLAQERIDAHPLRYYVVLPLRRAVTLWFDTHADFYPFAGFLFPVSGWDRETQQQVWLPLFAVLVAVWTLAGWVGAWQLARYRDGCIWLVLVALLILPRLAVLAGLENPEPRYTVEFFPIVSALAAIGIPRMPGGRLSP
jgi:hypothetical protein